jgi:hypothetical protein
MERAACPRAYLWPKDIDYSYPKEIVMIRNLEIKADDKGHIQHLRVVFGPHHFLELTEAEGKVSLALGATHHGFEVDASEVNSELERLVEEIRRQHPEKAID